MPIASPVDAKLQNHSCAVAHSFSTPLSPADTQALLSVPMASLVDAELLPEGSSKNENGKSGQSAEMVSVEGILCLYFILTMAK